MKDEYKTIKLTKDIDMDLYESGIICFEINNIAYEYSPYIEIPKEGSDKLREIIIRKFL